MKRIWIFVRGQRYRKKAMRLLNLLWLHRRVWYIFDMDECLICVMNCGKLRKIIIRRALRGEAFRLIEN